MAICRKPYMPSARVFAPCGQCPECLTNRKQLWTNRNILESYSHEKQSFVTLTYDPENVPQNHKGIPTLVKDDIQRFFKNLRSKLPHKIRYYSVGEYGTSGERGINPHYHVLLYGLDETRADTIQDAWRAKAGRGKKGQILGFTKTGTVTHQSIAYVTGYVHKKTKYNKDMYEELEILPEFCTQSNRPAIGHNAIEKLVKLFKQSPDYLTAYGDVPYSIMHGSRSLPLGNYLREKIREGLDLPHDIEIYMDKETGEIIEKKIWHGKEEAKAQRDTELRLMQENKVNHDPKLSQDAQVSLSHYYQYKNQQAQKNFDAKQKLQYNSHSL